MQKDVNYALLMVILGLLIAIVGMSIYYQNTYKGLSGTYDVTLKQLEERINELNAKEQMLTQTQQELNTTQKDKAVLSDKYTNLKSEKDKVDKELSDTRAQRDALNQILASYRAKRAELYNATINLRSAIDALSSKIDANETLKASLSADINWADERMDIVEQKMLSMQSLP